MIRLSQSIPEYPRLSQVSQTIPEQSIPDYSRLFGLSEGEKTRKGKRNISCFSYIFYRKTSGKGFAWNPLNGLTILTPICARPEFAFHRVSIHAVHPYMPYISTHSTHSVHSVHSVKLCETLWYYVILYDTMWYYVILCDIMWHYGILCDIMWYYVILCDIMWYHVIFCDTIRRYRLWSNIMLYYWVLGT